MLMLCDRFTIAFGTPEMLEPSSLEPMQVHWMNREQKKQLCYTAQRFKKYACVLRPVRCSVFKYQLREAIFRIPSLQHDFVGGSHQLFYQTPFHDGFGLEWLCVVDGHEAVRCSSKRLTSSISIKKYLMGSISKCH